MTEKELINRIQLLKQINPKEDWVISMRAKLAFRMEMERKRDLLNKDLFAFRELFSFLSIKQPGLSFNAVYGVIVAIGLILGGGAVTALAAMQSSPGSPLYPVKLSIEKARLVASLSEESKLQFQTEIADKRLQELSVVVASQESAEQKAEKVTQVVDNIQEQLANASNQLPKVQPQKAVAAAKAVSEKANQFSKALATAKESLPSNIKPELDTKIAEIAETAEQAGLQALETMIANQNSTEVKKEDIIARLNETIAKVQEQVDAREKRITQEISFADKLPIRAVLINQTEQSRELLEKAKQAIKTNDFAGALQFVKAVKAIESGAEKMVQNADKAISDEAAKSQSQNATSSEAVNSAK